MNPETMPDKLLHNLIIGDEETYIFLFREYYAGLCAYSHRYIGHKEIAEEIVSETFIKIWENRDTIVIKSSIKAYLFQAVCNNSLNYLRKAKHENLMRIYLQDPKFDNLIFGETIDDTEEQNLLPEDFTLKMEEAVSQLPPQQQEAFRLKRREGKKIREVAQLMGLSVKTVEMHLSKATSNLKKKLKGYLPAFLLFMLLK